MAITPMPDPLTDAGQLRAKAELFIRQLEVNGYKSLPCAVCRRSPIIGVDDLHNLIRELLAAVDQIQPGAAQLCQCGHDRAHHHIDGCSFGWLPEPGVQWRGMALGNACSCRLFSLTQPGAAGQEIEK